jgi:hypothetical protein
VWGGGRKKRKPPNTPLTPEFPYGSVFILP